MRRLFQFIFRFRTFFVFVAIEIFCLFIIFNKNSYHHAIFYGTSNRVIASVLDRVNNAYEFINLAETNRILNEENARLREEVDKLKMGIFKLDGFEINDPKLLNQFEYIRADVVDNSVSLTRNYITLDRGRNDGIEVGYGVLGPEGIAGKVKSVSDHFSVVTSVLNQDLYTSVSIEPSLAFGSLKWDTTDPLSSSLLFIPRHISVQKGQKVITSGFNSIFPKGLPVGTIKDVVLPEGSSFYEISVSLNTDFTRLDKVYIIKNTLFEEADTLLLQNEGGIQ